MTNPLVPLYCQYPGQTEPQPAYLQIDDDGAITLDYSGEIGNAVPADVWHGLVSRHPISELLSADQCAAVLVDATVVALAARVHAGRSSVWDGNNYVGRLTDDAEQATEQLDDYLAEIDGDLLAQEVDEWLQNYTPTGAENEAETLEAEAVAEGIALIGDVADWLLNKLATAEENENA
jgi:hypothetical protein